MSGVLTLEQKQANAVRRVDSFVRRFEPGYYELVCHAALPLVLTPELVSYLRNAFLRGLPWVAEVDLLLSDLCTPAGYERYVMDVDVRSHVLQQRSATFTTERMAEVANLLVSYVRYLAGQGLGEGELRSQQWAAMMYLSPAAKAQAVTEIADRFQSVGNSNPIGSGLIDKAEMAQLSQIVATVKDQLDDYAE